jgi:hypothetical protein
MLKPADAYFASQPEPVKACLEFLRAFVLGHTAGVQERLSYGMPFYYLGSRRFCYLWVQKHSGLPYLGIVNGSAIDFPGLIAENRSRMKIYVVDPTEDIPTYDIRQLLDLAIGYAAE